MKTSEIKEVEAIIQYEFNNKMLLQQAFMFDPDEDENNPNSSEILRTIGKRTINFSTTQILMEYYGLYTKNHIFKASNSNATINDLLNSLYSKDIFARNTVLLGLDKFLSIPDDGIFQDINRKLFEAIIGAVTLDSKWNMPIVNDVLSYLLDIDYYLDNGFDLTNHFVTLIHNWSIQFDQVPIYDFDAHLDNSGNHIYTCKLYLPNIEGYFIEEGNTKSEVRMNVAKKAYEFLIDNNMISTLHNVELEPDINKAVDQLKQLAIEGYFSLPEYDITELEDGYQSRCSIDECDRTFTCEAELEEDAIMNSAYKMLLYILGYETE